MNSSQFKPVERRVSKHGILAYNGESFPIGKAHAGKIVHVGLSPVKRTPVIWCDKDRKPLFGSSAKRTPDGTWCMLKKLFRLKEAPTNDNAR